MANETDPEAQRILPTPDALRPHPRDIIERDFRDSSELERRKIVRENVVQL